MANAITCMRAVCGLSLIFCPTFSVWFYLLYFAGGISDVLDGLIARHFGKETKLGARLDTLADIVFGAAVLIKICFSVSISLWLVVWIALIAVIKIVNIICGFVICRRFVSEHTLMNKICGVLLFAIPICIDVFSRNIALIFVAVACAVATFAAIEEGHYIRSEKEIH